MNTLLEAEEDKCINNNIRKRSEFEGHHHRLSMKTIEEKHTSLTDSIDFTATTQWNDEEERAPQSILLYLLMEMDDDFTRECLSENQDYQHQ